MENINPQNPETKKPDSPGFEKKPEPEKSVVKEIHHHHYGRKGPGRFFFGLFVIIVGLMFLGRAAGWLPQDIHINWSWVWPLVIIFIGLSILSCRGWFSWISGSIITILVLLLVAWMIFGNLGDKNLINQEVGFDKSANVTRAVVNLKTGATKLNIKGDSSKLLTGNFGSYNLDLKQQEETKDNVQNITLETTSSWKWFTSSKNTIDLQLTNDLPVSLNIDSGASDMDLDLTNIMAKVVDVDTGASTFNLTLGDKADLVSINVDAGASTINITLPKILGAKINIDADATAKNLTDFDKIDDKTYESKGYAAATKKVNLDFSQGASTLNVNWK
ncbi:MAG: hypothetical protein COT26_03470 [Candidatus Kerfeldbacteria bacterium CG08_land_8_20_14_0_20_43_14]|uniref:DUF2154 domain-containing protein n=2 Tax=Bacteria candidate phyla TaxID=1783234 RepID=A0A2H0YPG3_9BACT|nr:MAG: hypothetical protein COT26_03470 [Candidatus Kerfeldbacteria bacterium CG08_land_8_20_14_0_20_43_14]